jgi:hypothetical protein
MSRPYYFLHVNEEGTEIAYRDEPSRSVTPTLSIWRVQNDEGNWEETLIRAREPRGADWQWVAQEDYASSRWRRPARRPEDLKWVLKRSDPGGHIPGRANVKRKKRQGGARIAGHA